MISMLHKFASETVSMPSLTFLYSIYNKLTIKSSYYHGFAHNFHHSNTETFLHCKIERDSNCLSQFAACYQSLAQPSLHFEIVLLFKNRLPTTTSFNNDSTVTIFIYKFLNTIATKEN